MHRPTRHAAHLAIVLALIAAVLAVPAPPADAATPGLDKTLDAGKQTGQNPDGSFRSGSNVVFTLSVSCIDDGGDPDCAGYELIDAAPTFTDVFGNPAAMSFVSASAGATAITVSTSGDPTITFNTPLTAGQSANVDLVYAIPPWITPDLTTVTNVATWGPPGGEATSPPVEVTSRARAAWNTTKTGPAQLNLNDNGTFTVAVCATTPTDPAFGPLAATLAGTQIVDQLPVAPAGTTLVFVSATGGGVYDPDTGPNGTVTWNVGDLTLAGGCHTEQVTIRFEAATPLAAAVPVTNSVSASGTPSVPDFDFSTDASTTFTLRNTPPGNPTVAKTATRSVVDLDLADGEDDSVFEYRIRPRNTGQGPVEDFVVTDVLNQHVTVTEVRTGTWPAGPTGPAGDNLVEFEIALASGPPIIFTASGSSVVTQVIPDPIGNPMVGLTARYGTVPAGWNHGNNANAIRLTSYMINPGRDGGFMDLVNNRTFVVPNTATVTGTTFDPLGNPIAPPPVVNSTVNVTVVAPQPAPTISKSSEIVAGPAIGGSTYPGGTIRWTITVTNPTAQATAALPDPSIYDIVPNLAGPAGTGLGAPYNYSVTAPATLSLIDPGSNGVTDDTDTRDGGQLLVWDFAGSLARGATMTISFDTDVLPNTPPQTAVNRAWVGTNALDESAGEWYSTFNNGSGTWEADVFDLDGDGNTTERVRRANAGVNILDYVIASSAKTVAGPEISPSDPICDLLDDPLDPSSNVTYGSGRCTRPGDRIDYSLTVANDGNVPLVDLVLIDMFPMPNDTLVLPNQSDGTVPGRGPGGVGSDFAPNLIGPVTSADPNVLVEYTTEPNPCRGGDFYPQLLPTSATWPPGCGDPNWTTTLPVPITDTRAIRVTYTAPLGVNESFSFAWPMRAPVTAPLGGVAYNAFAWSARSADSAARNQSAPPVVSVKISDQPKPWLLGDRAWFDANYDGIQDSSEAAGVPGVPFAVFFDNNLDGVYTPGVDTLVATTATDVGANAGEYLFNDLVDGTYFVFAAAPASWVVSPALAGLNPAADSNFSPFGTLGVDLTPGDMGGWNPAALSPALYSNIWAAPPVVIASDNDLTVDLGLWRPAPGIAVEKSTNDVDADVAPGVFIPVGQTVVWTYEVTNTGNTALSDLALVDTTTIGTAVPVTVVCADTTLAIGASTNCAASVPSTSVGGQYGNEVVATAVPVLPAIPWPAATYASLLRLDGTPFFDGAGDPIPVTASDPSHYFGANPSIALVKTINADDANTAPGVFIPVGGTVTWDITVTNTGNTDLYITHVTDDVLGVFGDDGDPLATNQTCPAGNLTFPITLAPGASRNCVVQGAATFGAHLNTADVSGLPVDDQGDPIPNFDGTGTPDGTFMAPVTASDPANYYGYAIPGIDISKSTSGTGPTGPVGPSDSDTAPGDELIAGTPVTWTYVISNTGNVPLRITHFDDDIEGVFGADGNPGTTNLTCAVGSGGTTTFPTVVAVGDDITCTVNGIAVAGAYANVATVTGTPLDGDGNPITSQLTPTSPTVPVPVVPPTATDPSHYTGLDSADIGLDKTTEGRLYDIDTGAIATIGPADGLTLTGGYDLAWHYVITNPGANALDSVVLVDDAGTPADPSDDVTIEVVSSGPSAGTLIVTGMPAAGVTLSGDTGGDGILSPGEVWTIVVPGTSILGSYANTATVTGRPIDTAGDPVVDVDGDPLPRPSDTDDSDYAGVVGPLPSISISKATNSVDADDAPGPIVPVLETVTWTYVLTNTGNTHLRITHFVDDPEGVFGDDGNPATPNLACASGDLTLPVVLAPGEFRTCTYTGTVAFGQYRNDVEVTATPVSSTDVPLPVYNSDGTPTGDTVPDVSSQDPSHHYGYAIPGIDIEKSTSGTGPTGPVGPSDSDTAPGDELIAGTPVTWTYVISNTGNVPLRITHFDDDIEGVFGDDGVAPPRSCDRGTATFPMALAPSASVTCEVDGIAILGAYANVATVTGTPLDGDGNPITSQLTPTSPTVPVPVVPPTATDPSHYTGVGGPTIGLDKTTTGRAYDLGSGLVTEVGPGDGLFLTDGLDLVWTFTVTNPTSVALAEVVLVDDAGTPADPSDDVTIEVVSSGPSAGTLVVTGMPAAGVTLSGDTGGDGILSPGEVWTIIVPGTSILGAYANSATVTGQPVDVNGDPVLDPDGDVVPTVTATDDSDYTGLRPPSVSLEKATNGVDADDPDGPYVRAGDTVTWTFEVTNTGDTALLDAVVTDPALGGAVCTFALVLPGQTLTCDVTGQRFGSGTQRNDAAVSARPAAPTSPVDPLDTSTWPTDPADYVVFLDDLTGSEVDPVTDDDPSHHFGADPSISLTKLVNGRATTPTDPLVVTPGGPVTWTFIVTNTGNTTLVDVVVRDVLIAGTGVGAGGPVTAACPTTVLAPGASMTCVLTGVAGRIDHTNEATAIGRPVDAGGNGVGNPVNDSDRSHYRPATSDLALDKAIVAGVDANGAINANELTWSLTVTNRGPDPATGVTVVDVLPPALAFRSASGPWDCTHVAGTVTCAWPGGVAVGQTVTLTIVTAVVDPTGAITNAASVDGDNVDPNPDDNADDATAHPAVRPDLPTTGSDPNPSDSTATSRPTVRPDLPTTGSDLDSVTLALVLLVAGAVLVGATRRRHTGTAS